MTTVSTRTDEDIQEDVLAELRWDSRVRPNDIGVIVKNGVVTLTGWVESYSQKVAAESAAHRVRGVLAVANDIEVRLPAFAERTDADLAAAVLNALKWGADIPAGKINVTVDQGWVTLDGEVDNILQKLDAERAVSHIAGVRGVSNRLIVKEHPLPTDIKKKIEQALVRNAETDAKQITVEVQGSKVILRGIVHAYAEKRAAAETAWSLPGVTEVENNIDVVFPP
ncbi:ornithine aminotransferase [Dictyobacter alpinus]|uniref:Ornithine aminotransferase n=1 Tax=Dictyobacter alpinus TaxID=2014873 RepID=A0A402B172_9CHLR|nr:BON domain-containing protein [Dictyobacter alpinus]GCE25104.1 ornithine aminotransferase [Dictyobacter alpinus]